MASECEFKDWINAMEIFHFNLDSKIALLELMNLDSEKYVTEWSYIEDKEYYEFLSFVDLIEKHNLKEKSFSFKFSSKGKEYILDESKFYEYGLYLPEVVDFCRMLIDGDIY